VMGARLLGVAGKVQRVDSTDDIGASVFHLVAERLWDWSADLDRIADIDGRFELRTGRGRARLSASPRPSSPTTAAVSTSTGRRSRSPHATSTDTVIPRPQAEGSFDP